MRLFLGLALSALAGVGQAQTVIGCFTDSPATQVASLGLIPEPWEDHTRTFANGAIRATLVDTIEPVCCGQYLVLTTEDPDEGPQCWIVADTGFGFAAIGFDRITAADDPTTGLGLTVPVGRLPTGLEIDPVWSDLLVTVNRADKTVTAVAQ